MTLEEIKKYLACAFEMELDVYIQENIIVRMKNTSAKLGLYTAIYKPQRKANNTDISEYMLGAGVIIGLICAVVVAIVEFCTSGGGFGAVILCVIAGIIYGAIGLIVGGLTIGTIFGLIARKLRSNEIEQEYQSSMAEYKKKIDKDNRRVNKEKLQKQALDNEIKAMQVSLKQTRQNLKKIYSYNILNPDYHNIYAVSSIYGYFVKERTKSLSFNEQTGDQGAYNIYEYERRMNKIIMNTEEILNKLDEVIHNQYKLVSGLQKANRQISSLCSGVSSFMEKASDSLQSIERCQSIAAYNSERTRRELEFMTWMQLYR